MATYHEQFEEDVRPKLDLLDNIRNLLNKETGVDLPAVVVIGDQSSGKSSVLEALSHISFPRGEGIVFYYFIIIILLYFYYGILNLPFALPQKLHLEAVKFSLLLPGGLRYDFLYWTRIDVMLCGV